jgi:hypothetical protein
MHPGCMAMCYCEEAFVHCSMEIGRLINAIVEYLGSRWRLFSVVSQLVEAVKKTVSETQRRPDISGRLFCANALICLKILFQIENLRPR